MRHGKNGWVLADMQRHWETTFDGVFKSERVVLTYENEHTGERARIERDLTRQPINRTTLRQGFFTKRQFRALVEEHGERYARRVVGGGQS